MLLVLWLTFDLLCKHETSPKILSNQMLFTALYYTTMSLPPKYYAQSYLTKVYYLDGMCHSPLVNYCASTISMYTCWTVMLPISSIMIVPTLVWELRLAPRSINSVHTSTWPFWEAMCKGEAPSCRVDNTIHMLINFLSGIGCSGRLASSVGPLVWKYCKVQQQKSSFT